MREVTSINPPAHKGSPYCGDVCCVKQRDYTGDTSCGLIERGVFVSFAPERSQLEAGAGFAAV